MQDIDTFVEFNHTYPVTPREYVELFHLSFLRVLTSASDRASYRVKGGCNLRFWFGSVRYSEDLDLDVVVTARATLKNKVDRMLEAGALPALLRARGMAVEHASAPKQSETTQRWKVSLSAEGLVAPLHTKVEFSRRAPAGGHAYEPVDPDLARRYRIPAPFAHHYLAPAALAQKVHALARRKEVQARDVFDLQLLLSSAPAELAIDEAARKDAPAAILRAMDIDYDDFASQVAAFLEPEHASLYATREAWERMQAEVVSGLERLAA